MYLKYYDIFVRNAFGNYFDVMKEVSYSGMMGKMLSYEDGRSYQSNYELFGFGKYPDENYAREIMQLFSIGLWKLNNNGTIQIGENGKSKETYTNLDIQNIARIWTGFKARPHRKNLEFFGNGRINLNDPMYISHSDHDTFPKQGLDQFHIGDGYPLCDNLPARSFLRKNAKYRFLSSTLSNEMVSRPSSLTLNTSSALYAALCNANSRGKCVLKSIYFK
jgi:hypothetical protein